MKVVHLATFDTQGGAAVAALRLVDGLRRRGHDARVLVRDKMTAHPYVDALTGTGGRPPEVQGDGAVAQFAWLLTQRARSSRSDTLFSSDVATYNVADHPLVRASDIVHLHWVTGFVSASEIRRLQNLGKPIVWTLHDQFPFTGGCHYSQDCRGFVKRCTDCPQLLPEARPLAALTLAHKRDLLDPARLTLAAPSRWLATCARKSALFRKARIEVVPYGLDVDARRRVTREAARQALNIAPNAVVMFASSVNSRETRKGDAHLVEALRLIRRSRSLLPPATARRLLVLTAGEGARDESIEGFRCMTLGALAADDPKLEMAYRAADLFVLPSLEDNLPNTLLEAMAADVPVVAYRTGGVPDFLRDGVNGRVVPRGDTKGLARAIAALVKNPEARRRLGAAAVETARQAFDWPIQAAAYERIYESEAARVAHVTRRSAPGSRLRRPAKKAPTAPPGLAALMTDRSASRLLVSLLRQEADELQRVVAARGGEIRELKNAVGAHRSDIATLQAVIASRGGEIRELRNAIATLERERVELERLRTAEAEQHRALARGLMTAPSATNRPSIGIFGVGEGAVRAVAAVALLDGAVAWFSDNNSETHGSAILGREVIPPDRIPDAPFDLVLIASSHRDPIRAQLVALGIHPDRIVAPDVSQPHTNLVEELRQLLGLLT